MQTNDFIPPFEPNFSETALRILPQRYFATAKDGTQEGPTAFLVRVASAIAAADARYDQDPTIARSAFYAILANLDFLPNTPCLVNAGRPKPMLSACFVLPVDDSIIGIYKSIAQMASIQQGGGGTGFAFSRLREGGSFVHSTGREASGPLSFMRVHNAATDSIKQGGVRRGANMAVLRVDHPDIFAFIRAKKDLDNENVGVFNKMADSGRYTPEALAHARQVLLETQYENFNISVGVTSTFMQAVDADGEFALVSPTTGETAQWIRARDLMDAIVEGAWLNGEPGILFLDHPGVNALPGLGPIEATNPCGEVFLHPYDSCNLGSINLGRFFVKGAGYSASLPDLDFERLAQVTQTATRFLDNVIDETVAPVEEINQMVRANRRIGLGNMGFADMLLQLGIPYGSPECLDVIDEVWGFVQSVAEKTSEELGAQRGNFPNKPLSIFADDPRPRRNVALTSVAPTGSIAMIANASYGAEPYFGIAYEKHAMKDGEGRAQRFFHVIPQFEVIARDRGFFSDDLLAKIAHNGGSVRGIADVPTDIQRVFTVTADISVAEHIDVLAAFQRHTDNAVSKTINAPNHDTRESVREAIFRAYRSGCKGFTYYRDGSRAEQVMNFSTASDLASNPEPASAPAAQAGETPDLATMLARAREVLAQ